jgi:hypothetical protein
LRGPEARRPRGPKPEKLETAKALIRNMLADGVEHPAAKLIDAAKKCGISVSTLDDAVDELGVKRRKAAFGGGWLWSLNPQDNSASSAEHSKYTNNYVSSTGLKGGLRFSEDSNSASSGQNAKAQSSPKNRDVEGF